MHPDGMTKSSDFHPSTRSEVLAAIVFVVLIGVMGALLITLWRAAGA